MSALSCQSAWWSWPVELLTCVYWTRRTPHYPGRTPRLPPFSLFFLSPSLFHFVFVHFYQSLCPSSPHHFLFSFSLLKSTATFPAPPQFFSLLSYMVYFPLLLHHPFVSRPPLFSCCPFLFWYYFGTSLSARSLSSRSVSFGGRCSSLRRTWLSTRRARTPQLDD